MREAEGVAVSLEQSRKKERTLEEEGRRLAQERADALQLVKELQGEQHAVVGGREKSMYQTLDDANVMCFMTFCLHGEVDSFTP